MLQERNTAPLKEKKGTGYLNFPLPILLLPVRAHSSGIPLVVLFFLQNVTQSGEISMFRGDTKVSGSR